MKRDQAKSGTNTNPNKITKFTSPRENIGRKYAGIGRKRVIHGPRRTGSPLMLPLRRALGCAEALPLTGKTGFEFLNPLWQQLSVLLPVNRSVQGQR